jgi:RNA polymerase sigma-70 factor (ECF subfamily)
VSLLRDRDDAERPSDGPRRWTAPAEPDTTDFDTLVRSHGARLCNFAVRFVRSHDIAEDIVQDVFLAIWRRQTEFDYADPLPYLYQAVRNRAVMHARQQRVRDRWREAVEATAEPAETEPADADTADLAAALARAVEALPERCRLVFTMSREQDLTYAEIARLLGISIKTVETQMGRALKALRSGVADYLTLAVTLASTMRWLA